MAHKVRFLSLAALLLLISLMGTLVLAQAEPLVLQDFEGADAPTMEVYQVTASIEDGALVSASTEGEWHTIGAGFIGAPVDISGYGEFCFDINDTTAANNTVGVKLFDASGANQEKWTDHEGVGVNPKTVTDEWVTMCLNLSAFTDIDLTAVEHVEFAMFAAGTYKFDNLIAQAAQTDVEVTPEATEAPLDTSNMVLQEVPVQGFEAEETYYGHYQAEVSLSTEVVHSGDSALMATSAEGEWHSFGAYPEPRPFDASEYSKVCFWIYDTTTNNNGLAENSVGVRLFDGRLIDQEAWTDHVGAGDNPKTVTDEWVQMCINLDLYSNLDLTQIDKIEFSMYWAGTYYIDDVIFVPRAAE